jgi:hypothetical protein
MGFSDFRSALQHEVVHVIQMLIMGADEFSHDLWFFEGLPEAMTGGTAGGAIRGLDQFDALRKEYGNINPISIKGYPQAGAPDIGESYEYPMYQLAVEYLTDPRGRGRSLADAGSLMVDVAEGSTFDAAFARHMGMEVREFERGFFDSMRGYLPRYRSAAFSPAGFLLISIGVITLVVTSLVVANRRWSLTTVELPEPGRGARLGFRAEVVASTAIVVLFFLGALSAAGTLNIFNNASNAAARQRTI